MRYTARHGSTGFAVDDHLRFDFPGFQRGVGRFAVSGIGQFQGLSFLQIGQRGTGLIDAGLVFGGDAFTVDGGDDISGLKSGILGRSFRADRSDFHALAAVRRHDHTQTDSRTGRVHFNPLRTTLVLDSPRTFAGRRGGGDVALDHAGFAVAHGFDDGDLHLVIRTELLRQLLDALAQLLDFRARGFLFIGGCFRGLPVGACGKKACGEYQRDDVFRGEHGSLLGGWFSWCWPGPDRNCGRPR